jgi:RES domain-containing protein
MSTPWTPAFTPDRARLIGMYRGLLYRALNPVYAREPLSGRGAELYGGRFNAKGTPALYASLTIQTALREANQVGSLQPTTLVCYDAEIERVFDTRDAMALAAEGMDTDALADAGWRDQMRKSGEARTQGFARRLAGEGYQGLLVRSFARGARADDMNLVLFSWGAGPPSRLTLIDDEKRLG